MQSGRAAIHSNSMRNTGNARQSILELRQARAQTQVLTPENVEHSSFVSFIDPLR
jgi:hypothetical protein